MSEPPHVRRSLRALRAIRRSPVLAVAPTVVIVGAGAGYALVEGVAAGFGVGAPTDVPIGWDAYRRVLAAPSFWPSATLTVWVGVASTVLAVAGASLVSWWWVTAPGRLRRIDLMLVHVTVSLPHIAWAVALAGVASQSGLLARLATAIGAIDRPAQFPVLVGDHAGLGIIVGLATKEVGFVTLAVLPLATRRARSALSTASTLGASPAQRFRWVHLPAIAPALAPAAAAVFAYSVGSYELPLTLGTNRPRTLAVAAFDAFRDADLNRRADAFAISTLLAGLALLAALSVTMPFLGRSRARARHGKGAT